MESPAPSPLHQEHLQGESGPSGWEVDGDNEGVRSQWWWPPQRPAVTEIKVKTVLTTPAPMVAYAGCPTPADSKMLVE